MSEFLAQLPAVPGVYYEPRPRSPAAPLVRTDVAGFVGFEPRVTNGTTPSRLIYDTSETGLALEGHELNVDLAGFFLDVGATCLWIPPVTNLPLSAGADWRPVDGGEGIVYSLVAARNASGTSRLLVLPGERANLNHQQPISDADIRMQIPCVSNGGNQFHIDVCSFHVQIGDGIHLIPSTVDFPLSDNLPTAPIADGESIVYALVAVEGDGAAELVAVEGTARATSNERPPSDAKVRAGLRERHAGADWTRITDVTVSLESGAVSIQVSTPLWARIADIHVTRSGEAIYLETVPALPPAKLEDWKDYVLRFGLPRADGTLLAHAVRAFFANGGSRCYVTTVRRPDFLYTEGLGRALEDMVGVKGASEGEATGLERLLLIPEVSIVDVPDLHAVRPQDPPEPFDLPPLDEAACFIACEELRTTGSAHALGRSECTKPLFHEAQVQDIQTRLLHRCMEERWRVFLLLNIPAERDADSGCFRRPSKEKAVEWREHFASLGEDAQEMSCAGLYFPWVMSQERADAPVVEMPPTPFVAGVMARRDLARGAHVSPANETVRGVVGVTWPIDDEANAELYEPTSNINILRPFPGYGIQLWGARTLSSDRWLRYVAVRRCLSLIERRAVVALQPVVFEPNTPMLWLQVSQLMLDILLPLFESGALRGKRPDEAFTVRCDASVNTPELVEQGMLVCEVGVAIVAPAELIVFRLGRREGVVEVMETPHA
jgi:hypothetical protein